MQEARYIRGPADPARIDLDEEHEVHYWTKLLDVSETKLRAAVAFAGIMALDVRAYLGFPDAPRSAVSREHGASDCPDFYSSPELPAGLPKTTRAPASHALQANVRALSKLAHFSHLLKRAR